MITPNSCSLRPPLFREIHRHLGQVLGQPGGWSPAPRAALAQLLGIHVGVRQQGGVGKSLGLARSRAFDALLDGRGELTRTAARQLLVGDAGDVEMDVDAVQQRANDPPLVALTTRIPSNHITTAA